MTGTLTAGTLVSLGLGSKRRPGQGARREALYAPLDEHRTAASAGDVAAAWFAAGLVGLALLGALAI